MSFDWKDYVYFAEELLNQAGEAPLRSSISRAYYGAFCIARNRKGYKNYKGTDIHWRVINEYKNSSDKEEQAIGLTLAELRRLRNNADYREDKPIDRDLAERVVFSAKFILTSMRIT